MFKSPKKYTNLFVEILAHFKATDAFYHAVPTLEAACPKPVDDDKLASQLIDYSWQFASPGQAKLRIKLLQETPNANLNCISKH